VTTYPAHGIHLRQPHLRRLVLGIVVAAALVGAGAWALVDRYASNSNRISDAQAITFFRTGEGLPGLSTMNGRQTVHSVALPASERPYAIRMYRGGPYDRNVLNLFYAVGAAATHFQPSADRQATLAIGRSNLATQIAAGANATHPEWITQYGVRVREAAAALVRGMFAGAG
jgi:hypothetical protein